MHIGDRLRDGQAYTNSIGNGGNPLVGHYAARAPRLHHGWCTSCSYTNHLGSGSNGFGPTPNPGEEGTITQGYQEIIDRLGVAQEFQGDRSRPFGNGWIKAIFNHGHAGSSGKAFSLQLSGIKILANEAHLCAKGTHTLKFQWVSVEACIDDHPDTPCPSSIGHRLSKVTGTRTDNGGRRWG